MDALQHKVQIKAESKTVVEWIYMHDFFRFAGRTLVVSWLPGNTLPSALKKGEGLIKREGTHSSLV